MSIKRGFKLQNRLVMSALALLLQFVLLFFGCLALSKNFLAVYAISEIFGILTVIFIINKRENPSYKMAWIIFILIMPFFGITVFILWGGARIAPPKKKRYTEIENRYLKKIKRDNTDFSRLYYEDYIHSRQANYLSKESGFPLYGETDMEYLSDGSAFFDALLKDLEEAQDYIFLQFFIIAEGYMWDKIFEILKRKANAGVEIRVMFDDFGSINRQDIGFIKNLEQNGIKVAVFNKIKPASTIANIFINNRNHQKIVIIDGKIAFTGGLNIADEYINKKKRFGNWLDCGARFYGKAVDGFLAIFCTMWEFTTESRVDFDRYAKAVRTEGKGFVLPYSDNPLGDTDAAKGIYMQILNSAQRYVYITTPYLIVDDDMMNALELAAKSGIDVRIITPHIPDKWYVHTVSQYNYLPLLKAGVRIYEYLPGFIHSKLFVSDDRVSTVGTVNMDYRSFSLHFECGAWVSDADFSMRIKNDILDTISKSKEITYKEWKKSPIYLRFKRALLNIFSPFM